MLRISGIESAPGGTPSTKAQVPEKFQISKHQTPKTDAGAIGAQAGYELGIRCFFGAWDLRFGAFGLGSRPLKNGDARLPAPFLDAWVFNRYGCS
jgi:hypothetical protein